MWAVFEEDAPTAKGTPTESQPFYLAALQRPHSSDGALSAWGFCRVRGIVYRLLWAGLARAKISPTLLALDRAEGGTLGRLRVTASSLASLFLRTFGILPFVRCAQARLYWVRVRP